MRRLLTVAVIAVLCLGGIVAADAATTRPVPFPTTPKGLKPPVKLPTALDATPGYVPQIACQPTTLPGVAKLRTLVLSTYGEGGAGNTARKCNEGTSEHSDGRAWDWMVNVKNADEKRAAGDFLAWLTANGGANARRLGIMYVIHNKLIWASYRASDGWRPSSGHTDHIHISFSWNGARGNTSFWTGAVHPTDHGPCAVFAGQPGVKQSAVRTSPCPKPSPLVRKHPYPVAEYGVTSTNVATARSLLKIKASKTFDSATTAAVRDYQKAHDLPQTGGLDVPTWASLIPSKATGDVTSGYYAKDAAAYALANYYETTLRTGSYGKSTKFLQLALRMRTVDRNGYFGAVTVAAVKKVQAAAGLSQTGVVGKPEWKAIAATFE